MLQRGRRSGKLIVVFGAAGERDPARRRGIARAVAELADYAVITNEDPRSEDPDAIIDEIAAALRSARLRQRKFERELDRRQALALAFDRAGQDDTVLLAGQGHRAVDRHRQRALAVGRARSRARVARGPRRAV